MSEKFDKLKSMLNYYQIDIKPEVNDKLTKSKKEILFEKIKRNIRYVDLLNERIKNIAESNKQADDAGESSDSSLGEIFDNIMGIGDTAPSKLLVGDFLVWLHLYTDGKTPLPELYEKSKHHMNFKFKTMDDLYTWFDNTDNYINTCDNIFLSALEMLDEKRDTMKVITFTVSESLIDKKIPPRPVTIFVFMKRKNILDIMDIYMKNLLDYDMVKKYKNVLNKFKERGIEL
ncbi:hypothetical protein [Microcystis phage Mel-JY01]